MPPRGPSRLPTGRGKSRTPASAPRSGGAGALGQGIVRPLSPVLEPPQPAFGAGLVDEGDLRGAALDDLADPAHRASRRARGPLDLRRALGRCGQQELVVLA